MAYRAVVEMVGSQSLLNRVTACAAEQGITNPSQWAQMNIWQICTAAGWADDWAYAKDTWTVNANPDLGERDDVIGDNKILAEVQALKEAQSL